MQTNDANNLTDDEMYSSKYLRFQKKQSYEEYSEGQKQKPVLRSWYAGRGGEGAKDLNHSESYFQKYFLYMSYIEASP